jgi:drug/metabolite transporter (DMT)-like permease
MLPMGSLKYSALLLLTAAIWGFAFVAQRSAMDHIGPFTFGGVRFAIGSITLIPLWLLLRNRNKDPKTIVSYSPASIWKSGLLLGTVLFIAVSIQQFGMKYTTAANGGFITSLYVILVPLFSIYLGQKVGMNIWIGALVAMAGLYFLSIHESFSLSWGDSLVLISAVFWAVHVLLIGHYAPKFPILLLSIIQFTATAVLSLLFALVFEEIRWSTLLDAHVPILYTGIVSVGVAYTLQVLAQTKVSSSQAAIILSFEAAFAMLGGWLLLHETHGLKSLFGASLMLVGIILSQINWKKSNL